jgi:hypothetical protein
MFIVRAFINYTITVAVWTILVPSVPHVLLTSAAAPGCVRDQP